MKERPIIFSTELIPKILDGSKVQTRRAIKIPEGGRIKVSTRYLSPNATNPKGGVSICFDQTGLADWKVMPCPYGQVGDRLWVRERWAELGWYDKGVKVHNIKDLEGEEHTIIYLAESLDFEWRGDDGGVEYRKDGTERSHWKSPRFMKKWASRITLEITNIRVERLQEIKRIDVWGEGIKCRHCKGYTDNKVGCTCILNFAKLWNSLNPRYSWESNPWVWVIEFKKENGL